MKKYREARKQNNLKVSEAAQKLGVPQPTLTSWENGTRNPPIDMLLKMAKLYQVSVDYLLGSDAQNEPMAEICAENLPVLAGKPVWVKKRGWALVNAERGQLLFSDGHTESFSAAPDILIPWGDKTLLVEAMQAPPLGPDDLHQGLCVWVEPISDDAILREELRGRYRIIGHYAENERGNRFALDTYGAKWLAYRVG